MRVEDPDQGNLEDQTVDLDETLSHERTSHFYLHSKTNNNSSFEPSGRNSRDVSVESQEARSMHQRKSIMNRLNQGVISLKATKPEAIEF